MKVKEFLAMQGAARDLLRLADDAGPDGNVSPKSISWAHQVVGSVYKAIDRTGPRKQAILALFDTPRPIGLSAAEIRTMTGLSEAGCSNAVYNMVQRGSLFRLECKYKPGRYFRTEADLEAARPEVVALDVADGFEVLNQRLELARAARRKRAEERRVAAAMERAQRPPKAEKPPKVPKPPKPEKAPKPPPPPPAPPAPPAPKPATVAKPKAPTKHQRQVMRDLLPERRPALKHDKPAKPAFNESVFIPPHVQVQRIPSPKGRYEVDGPIVGGFLSDWHTKRGQNPHDPRPIQD